jgi:FdrA protein
VVLDLGDDAFTLGRPHPMIDPSVRLALIADQAADTQVRVILVDVVLGHCAEPDPAAGLVPAIRAALTRRAEDHVDRPLDVVVSLCGSDSDPQDLHRQAQALVDAGAHVHTSNAAAARHAATIAQGGVR